MTTKRVKLITAALALVLVIGLAILILSTPRSGVRAHSTDKRIKILNAQYFPGTYIDYSYLPLHQKPQFYFQQLLQKLGAQRASWWVSPYIVRVGGPGMVILGRSQIDDTESIELVSDVGESRSQVRIWPDEQNRPKILLWLGRLNGDTFHLRYVGETNDLAVIRIR